MRDGWYREEKAAEPIYGGGGGRRQTTGKQTRLYNAESEIREHIIKKLRVGHTSTQRGTQHPAYRAITVAQVRGRCTGESHTYVRRRGGGQRAGTDKGRLFTKKRKASRHGALGKKSQKSGRRRLPTRTHQLENSSHLVDEAVELDDDGPHDVGHGERQGHERRERPEEVGQPGGALSGHLEDHVLEPPVLLRGRARAYARTQEEDKEKRKTKISSSSSSSTVAVRRAVHTAAAASAAASASASAVCSGRDNSWRFFAVCDQVRMHARRRTTAAAVRAR